MSNDPQQRLLAASIKGEPRRILAALCAGADPHGTDTNGRTPLMLAARAGSLKSVDALLRVSDPKHRDVEGQTALMLSALHKKAHCLSLLLPLSDPLAADSDGDTALTLAASFNSSACIEALFPVSDPTHLNRMGYNALALALCRNFPQSLAMLIRMRDPSLTPLSARLAKLLISRIYSPPTPVRRTHAGPRPDASRPAAKRVLDLCVGLDPACDQLLQFPAGFAPLGTPRPAKSAPMSLSKPKRGASAGPALSGDPYARSVVNEIALTIATELAKTKGKAGAKPKAPAKRAKRAKAAPRL